MRLVGFLFAAIASSGAALAQPVQPSGWMPIIEPNALYEGASAIYRPEGKALSPKALVARLDRLCESKRRIDQRRCDAAWTRINVEYAKMQAARVAQD